ncbi:hypothetical protein [Streptomyces sp. NPDC058297]|uniref:hypothetical protein n=1 Tax=unclassified Streptomyces TaxID=2593676 RepID=UPI0036E17BA7
MKKRDRPDVRHVDHPSSRGSDSKSVVTFSMLRADHGAACPPKEASVPPHDQDSAPSRRRFLVAGAACAGALVVPSVVSAQPAAAATNYTVTATNNSSQLLDCCWITAGNYSVGEVLDVEEITNTIEIPFDGTFSMQAVYGPSGDWSLH